MNPNKSVGACQFKSYDFYLNSKFIFFFQGFALFFFFGSKAFAPTTRALPNFLPNYDFSTNTHV